MSLYLPEITEETDVPLPGLDRVYVVDPPSVLAINAALAARRPLLVRGRPGCGKSQLARAAAALLDRAFIAFTVDALTEPRDLRWKTDDVARLAAAQLAGAQRGEGGSLAEVALERFLSPGPLWWAFDWASADGRPPGECRPVKPAPDWDEAKGSVLLIDEIDKADLSVPNGLLEALGDRRFEVPVLGPVEMGAVPPLVIITTNEERALPDAFLRRCLVMHLALPREREALVAHLLRRGGAHFPTCNRLVLLGAAELVADDHLAERSGEQLAPGLAEYIDLLRVITEQRSEPKAQLDLLRRVKQFALSKHEAEPPR